MSRQEGLAAEWLADAVRGSLYLIIAGLVVAVLCGVIAAVIADAEKRAGLGFVVGFLFGPFGVLIACFLPPADHVDVDRTAYWLAAIVALSFLCIVAVVLSMWAPLW